MSYRTLESRASEPAPRQPCTHARTTLAATPSYRSQVYVGDSPQWHRRRFKHLRRRAEPEGTPQGDGRKRPRKRHVINLCARQQYDGWPDDVEALEQWTAAASRSAKLLCSIGLNAYYGRMSSDRMSLLPEPASSSRKGLDRRQYNLSRARRSDRGNIGSTVLYST